MNEDPLVLDDAAENVSDAPIGWVIVAFVVACVPFVLLVAAIHSSLGAPK